MDYFYFFFLFTGPSTFARQILPLLCITTNYFLTATGAKYLRADLSARSAIKSIINFNELKIFDSAKGQHNAITILSKKCDKTAIACNATTTRIGQASQYDLARILSWNDEKTNYVDVKQSELYEGVDKQIRMGGYGNKSGEPSEIALEKIKDDSVLLGNICDVLSGVVSLADKVSPNHLKKYPETKGKKGDGILVLTNQELQRLNLAERRGQKVCKAIF